VFLCAFVNEGFSFHVKNTRTRNKVMNSLEYFGVDDISQIPSKGVGAPKLPRESIPDSFDWRNVDGVRYATPSKTQQVPHICGSCWAFAATGSLSDRVRIAAKGTPIDINLSPQTLLNCHTDAGDCNGGNSLAAYISVYESDTGITDETCTPYEGVDYTNWGESDCADRMCKTHDLYGQSYWVNGSRVFVDSYGTVDATDLDALMSEVYAAGPIACYMYAHSDSFEDYTGGIITDDTAYDGITHVVSLVGWGTDTDLGLDYWVVRNSFGTYWGEQGYYRVERGINAFNMETGVCEWATPTQDSVDAIVASAALS
jgi:cathepsin X